MSSISSLPFPFLAIPFTYCQIREAKTGVEERMRTITKSVSLPSRKKAKVRLSRVIDTSDRETVLHLVWEFCYILLVLTANRLARICASSQDVGQRTS